MRIQGSWGYHNAGGGQYQPVYSGLYVYRYISSKRMDLNIVLCTLHVLGKHDSRRPLAKLLETILCMNDVHLANDEMVKAEY